MVGGGVCKEAARVQRAPRIRKAVAAAVVVAHIIRAIAATEEMGRMELRGVAAPAAVVKVLIPLALQEPAELMAVMVVLVKQEVVLGQAITLVALVWVVSYV